MAIKGLWPNSLKNSTDKPLAQGATFTGEPEAISVTEQPQSVSVTVFTDSGSAVEGLELQQSADGTNWDQVEKCTVQPNAIFVAERNLTQRYFRVVYRTSYAQTLFRLQTRYNTRPVTGTKADLPAAVQLAYNGEFVDQESRARMATRTVIALEDLAEEQRITNKHLAVLTDQYFTKGDI